MKTVFQNIRKNYVYTFLCRFNFSEAIWMLYLAHRGMSLVQIGLLESIFHISSMIFEIPTGIIADRYGRRVSRILSRVAAFAGTVLMISSHSFLGFLISFIFTALGYNLESGAGDALVYDSLIEMKQESEFIKVKGRQEVFYQSAQILSLTLGGFIATYSYTLVYLITLAIQIASLAQSFSFTEPAVQTEETASEKNKQPGLIRHCIDSVKTLRQNSGILLYIFFIEGFSLFYTTLYFYFQNFLKAEGYSEWMIGVTLAGASLAGILTSNKAYVLEKWAGKRNIILYTPMFAILCLGFIAFFPVEPLVFVIFSSVEGLLYVVFSQYINELIPSKNRATLLSIQAMIFSVMMVVLFPIVGSIAEHYSFKIAFTGMFAAALLLLPVITFSLLRKLKTASEGNHPN